MCIQGRYRFSALCLAVLLGLMGLSACTADPQMNEIGDSPVHPVKGTASSGATVFATSAAEPLTTAPAVSRTTAVTVAPHRTTAKTDRTTRLQTTHVTKRPGTPSSAGKGSTSRAKTTQPSDFLTSPSGTPVRVVLWRSPAAWEKQTAVAYTAETGVAVQFTTLAGDHYWSRILSSMKAGTAMGDICGFQSHAAAFPVCVAACMQPFPFRKTSRQDTAWDTARMKAYQINGQYYGVAVSGSWEHEATMLYYNADMLRQDKELLPKDLWRQGQWDWNRFLPILVRSVVRGRTCALDDQNTWIFAAGTDYVRYDGTRFASNLDDPKLASTIAGFFLLNSIFSPNIHGDSSIDQFRQGNLVMLGASSAYLQKSSQRGGEAGFADLGFAWDAVPFPVTSDSGVTVIDRSHLFGLVRGAACADGAEQFLRYWLDPRNQPSVSQMAARTDVQDVLDYLRQQTAIMPTYSNGVLGYIDPEGFDSFSQKMASVSMESYVPQLLEYYTPFVERCVAQCNQKLS